MAEDFNGLDDLFNGELDKKMSFLEEGGTKKGADGIYKVDLSLVKDKKRGWRSVLRFLPNLTQEKAIGESAIERISHFVNIKDEPELRGVFDSPKNFGEKCPLSDLYYSMKNSKNAVLVEKAEQLNFSRNYFSYVLVLEDEQQPELVGKIMIFRYGKVIKDKIQAEKTGEITGEQCNIFSLDAGKDFILIAKEVQAGDRTYPDYKMSTFKSDETSLPVYNKDKGVFKNVPLKDGKIDPKAKGLVVDFLLDREFDIKDFEPKRLTDEQHEKITSISNYLTGKFSGSYAKAQQPSKSDFSTSEDDFFSDMDTATTAESTTEFMGDEDDFFADL